MSFSQMIIMYPLAVQNDYIELKYSLRSVERFIKNPKVLIAGEQIPGWLINVTQLQVKDHPGRKQLSIRKKILAALEYSKEVFFMNDDFFLLQPTDPKKYPFYYTKTLNQVGEAGAKPLKKKLEELGKEIKHFDCHYPIVYKREKFKELEVFPADCIIKSMYCNFNDIEGIEIKDCKIHNKAKPRQIFEFIKDLPNCSTAANGVNSVIPVLEKLFPNKSKFEI